MDGRRRMAARCFPASLQALSNAVSKHCQSNLKEPACFWFASQWGVIVLIFLLLDYKCVYSFLFKYDMSDFYFPLKFLFLCAFPRPAPFSVSLLCSKTGTDPKRGFKTGLKQISIRKAPSTNLDNVEVPPCGTRNREKKWERSRLLEWTMHSMKFRFLEGKKMKTVVSTKCIWAGAYYIWNHDHWCLRHFIVQTGFKWFQTTRWLVFRGPRKSICVGVCFLISGEGISRGKWN